MAIESPALEGRRPSFARRAMHWWIAADVGTMLTEGYRNWSQKWDMLGTNTFVGQSIGNIAPTEGLTWLAHHGENYLIERRGWREGWARLTGAAFVGFANLAVESPLLFYNFYNAGDTNPEFMTDMSGAGLGYLLMKIPLMALWYMNGRQRNTKNT